MRMTENSPFLSCDFVYGAMVPNPGAPELTGAHARAAQVERRGWGDRLAPCGRGVEQGCPDFGLPVGAVSALRGIDDHAVDRGQSVAA